MTAPPKPGWVRISSTDPPLTLTVRLSGDKVNVSGFGGWTQITRPRRPPLTTWQAQPGLTLTLPIIFDKFRAGETSIEDRIATLEQMALPTGANDQPPQVTIQAKGGAIPHQELTWVISDLAYGDALMNWNGNRTRQQVTLTLMQYVAVVYLTQKSAANRRRHKAAAGKKPGAPRKRITAKRKAKASTSRAVVSAPDGEDLLTIAARELGDADRWVEIADLNGIRDPRSIATGQVIRLP